ncbi:hypothetical protein LCGC14_1273010 [marine sediment metagenome]|uniref:Squalene cyclase C-terminal domain-containing protein n=1 Tax=marine sediment metagenome TaxID=412755 RepID=A0A0F9NE67_9ZZZZ
MSKIKNLRIFKFILKDIFNKKTVISPNKFHLKKAIEWLQYACSCSGDDGISEGYSLLDGWKVSNLEVSGSIISTLLEYNKVYDLCNGRNYFELAKGIADWLCSIQFKSGAFRFRIIDDEGNKPSVFSTGRILSGLIDIYEESKNELYMSAIIKAGNYLVKKIQEDGSWIEQCYDNNVHSFNIMTSWALLKLYKLNGDIKYKKTAISNVYWTYKQKRRNFWFSNTAPNFDDSSSLQYILYVARGFLECGLILDNDSVSRVALDIVYVLSQYFNSEMNIPMVFTDKWYSLSEDCYSAYIAQLSVLLLRLYEVYDIRKYMVYALRLNDYLKSIQIMNKKRNIDGAIKDSNPIWGGYTPFTFSSITTNVFCDALMFENKCY